MSVDDSLFPDKSSMEEANSIWKGGVEEDAKANPVGDMTWRINSAVLERSGGGRLQIHYDLEVIAGGPVGAIGVQVQKYDGLGSSKQASITQQQLKRLGVDTSKVTLEKLPAVLVTLAGKMVAGKAKKNGDFYNINFNKVVTTPIGAQPAGAGAAANPKGGKSGPGKPKF